MLPNLTESIVRTSKYWQTTFYNHARGGKYDLPNCTDFVVCATAWCVNADAPLKLFTDRAAGGFPDAKNFYKLWAHQKGSTPKVAAIAVWGGSSYNYNAGHVAFVKSFEGNKITVYQSNYGGKYFEEKTYTVEVGKTTVGTGAPFIGFCYHPTYKDEPQPTPKPIPTYVVGRIYTLDAILKVRYGAGTQYRQKTYAQLTTNAKMNAYPSGINAGCLKKGTKVSCLEIRTINKEIWLRIPSGWICAYQNGNTFIK